MPTQWLPITTRSAIWRSRQQAARRTLSAVRHAAVAQGFSPLERWRLPLLCGIALLGFFALPFDIRGYMYYLNTRYAHLAAPLLDPAAEGVLGLEADEEHGVLVAADAVLEVVEDAARRWRAEGRSLEQVWVLACAGKP